MYSIADLYPNMGAFDTTELTVPEAEEQEKYQGRGEGYPVTRQKAVGIWAAAVVAFMLVWLFGGVGR